MSYFFEDIGINPNELSGKQIVHHLDSRIQDVLTEIQNSELWKLLTSPDSNPDLVREIMKEIYLEITMYQPDVIESTIAIIGQFPRSMNVNVIGEMLHHQVEEFDHGEMALRDYIALGGSEKEARNRKMSPSAFSIAAMWRFLCHKRDPFAYLGALYPFEGLTPIITDMVRPFLKEKGMKRKSMEFVDYHSTADLEHTAMVKKLIENIVDEYPESRESICYGIEYFLAIYPMPAWERACKRGRLRLQMAN